MPKPRFLAGISWGLDYNDYTPLQQYRKWSEISGLSLAKAQVSGWCFIWTGTGLYVRKRITQVWITGFRTCRAHHGHHMTFMFNLPIFCLWQKVHGAPHSFHESVPTVIYSQFFWCWISINMKKTILSGYSTTWFQSRKKSSKKSTFWSAVRRVTCDR